MNETKLFKDDRISVSGGGNALLPEGVTYAAKGSCDLTSVTHTWRSKGS